MNEQVTDQGSGNAGGNLALWLAIALLIAGVAGYYVFDARPEYQRWLVAAAGLAASLGVFLPSAPGRRFRGFMDSARTELRKVVWPTKQETWQTTLMVFIFVGVAGVFFWVVDLVLAWATRALTGQGG